MLPSSGTGGEPLVVRVVREFQERVARAEASEMQELARQWLMVEAALEGEMMALAREVDELRMNDLPATRSQILELRRWRSLAEQAKRQYEGFASFAEEVIQKRQAELARAGVEQAQAAIQAQFTQAGMVGSFNVLPVEAVQTMVGLAGDGSPLRKVLTSRYPETVNLILETLIRNTALGRNPRVTAREMRDRFGANLNHALTVARTEQLRVFRSATLAGYRESGVVEGWMRISARNEHVCAGCLMADNGQVYPTKQDYQAHPECHCASIPVVEGLSRLSWESGEEWFLRQGEGMQRTILGKGRFAAWQEGRYGLGQLVKTVRDPVWGEAVVPRPLRELVGG